MRTARPARRRGKTVRWTVFQCAARESTLLHQTESGSQLPLRSVLMRSPLGSRTALRVWTLLFYMASAARAGAASKNGHHRQSPKDVSSWGFTYSFLPLHFSFLASLPIHVLEALESKK